MGEMAEQEEFIYTSEHHKIKVINYEPGRNYDSDKNGPILSINMRRNEGEDEVGGKLINLDDG